MVLPSPSHELDLILNSIEERTEPTREQIGLFKLDVLSLIESKLPPIGLECVTLGQRFLAGEIPESSIREALERCWAYADRRWPSGGLGAGEAYAIRSVISFLHGLINDDNDFVDSISFFLNSVNSVEPHHSQEADLLNRYFGSREDS
jgi:hypothetical protein